MNPLDVPHKSQAPASANGAADPLPLQRAVEFLRAAMVAPSPANGAMSSNVERNGNSKSTVSLADLVHALRRRWLLALSLGLLTAGAAVALVFLILPAHYTVQAVVQIHSKSTPRIFSTSPDNVDPEFPIYRANQEAFIKSPMVLSKAVESPKNQNLRMFRDPGVVKWLESALKTDFLSPEKLHVTLSADDPQEVADVLNAIVESFVNENTRQELDRRQKELDVLKQNRRNIENTYLHKKDILRDAEEAAKIEDETTRAQNYSNALQNQTLVQRDVTMAGIELVTVQGELKALRQKESELPNLKLSDDEIDLELQKRPEGKPYIDAKFRLLEEIRVLQKFPPSPALANKEAELKSLVKEGEKRYAALMLSDIRNKIQIVESNLAAAQRKKESWEKEAKKSEERVNSLNPNRAVSTDIEFLRASLKELDASKSDLGKEIERRNAEPLPPPRVTAWSPAEPPSSKDMSRQLKFGTAGGLGLFLLTLFGVGFVELRSGKINAVEDVTGALGMNVIGTLPSVPPRARLGLLSGASKGNVLWQSRLDEAVDAIRSVILHTARNDNLRVIMVTSPGVGEGKTSLACQLAASLARAWRNTLLLDGDIRHPATHTLFNLPLDPGFSEVLRGEANANDVIKPTSVSRLWLMPAGHWDAHAVQALAQDNIKTFFETLKRQYEFIIVDSCPVLPVADALSLGQNVDGVLYAVLRDVSRVPALQAAQQRLANLNVRTLGAVLIGVNDYAGASGYQYAMVAGKAKD